MLSGSTRLIIVRFFSAFLIVAGMACVLISFLIAFIPFILMFMLILVCRLEGWTWEPGTKTRPESARIQKQGRLFWKSGSSRRQT